MVKGQPAETKVIISDVLKLVTDFDIYQLYIGRFKPNDVMHNPFRVDRHPSFVIGNKTGKWRHFDFADSGWRGGAIDLVMQIHHCDLDTALRKIDKDFRLGITTGTPNNMTSVITWERQSSRQFKPPLIQVVTRRFTTPELGYWNAYGLSADDLKAGNVFAPKDIYRNRRRIPHGNLLTFCYWYPELEAWKLYRPFAPERSKNTPCWQYKWDSAVPFDYCDGHSDVFGSEFGYLTKSRKERMVLRKALGTKAVADLQSENPHCVTGTVLMAFSRCRVKVAAMDSDEQGKRMSWWLTKEHGFNHCNTPDPLLEMEINDFAGMSKYSGIDSVFNHFKSKGLC